MVYPPNIGIFPSSDLVYTAVEIVSKSHTLHGTHGEPAAGDHLNRSTIYG
jgi:hypothetical protein